MDMPNNSPSSENLVQLEENFRLNPQLCNFVELIYQKRFQPMQSHRDIANLGHHLTNYLLSAGPSITRRFLEGMASVMQVGKSHTMRRPISALNSDTLTHTTLFLMKLAPKLDNFSPSEVHKKLESRVVAQLVHELAAAFSNATIFVVTPHRVQRSLVTKELTSFGLSLRTRNSSSDSSRIWVDTAERLQGIPPTSAL
jgi:hypothetical protein